MYLTLKYLKQSNNIVPIREPNKTINSIHDTYVENCRLNRVLKLTRKLARE